MERPPARQYGCSGVKDQCAARGRQNAGLGAGVPFCFHFEKDKVAAVLIASPF
jgi:hypothetical protein